ncbi:probable inactive poly [ADP-ribose] polymerase SRO3 isoform X1 [Coffea eugenioides]|uniref:probable inactive poly [ADP-ribose] polymerase SRO3 isoform X1 n=2 Tax=Coffea eugenioides TaxID=49369 RepID=UPI000F609F24|nr:probable inactive poly [ADP-ribose] polymerase SRO3 isoform X1 [Coffea eugenioides]
MNYMSSDSAMSGIGNFCSEKIVNMRNNNKMRIRVSPPQRRFASGSSFCDRQAQLLVQNHENFRKSAEPVRVMYYDVNGSWVDYPKEVLDLVKVSFLAGKPMVEVNIQGCDFLLDFYRMLEIQFDSGDEKSIAWIDVKGKCFFPKVFVNSSEAFVSYDRNEEILGNKCPKIEIEVKILEDSDNLDSLSGKRKRVSEEIEVEQIERGKSEGSSSNVRNLDAKRRQIVANEVDKARWEKTKLLNEGEKEYTIVKNLFLSGLRSEETDATITRIHQCTRTGVLDKARYEVFMKQMEIMKKARGDANMVFAWHGTSAEGVDSILAHGFGMPDQVQTPRPHGVGVYLSPAKLPHISAMMSDIDDNGEKHVILCRVLLGKCEKIEAGSNQKLPSSLDFDTGVDQLTDPKWYVVWPTNMSTHILPELVVSYKSANHVQGQVTGTPCVKLDSPVPSPFVAKLFAKLGRSLPPLKVLQLQTLCGSLKDGKVGKDMFMEQLRSVVGDEMLRSAINEIRG